MTRKNTQARVAKLHAKLVQIAIEMGYVASVAEFHAKSADSQERMIMSAGRLMSRRVGQGWSR